MSISTNLFSAALVAAGIASNSNAMPQPFYKANAEPVQSRIASLINTSTPITIQVDPDISFTLDPEFTEVYDDLQTTVVSGSTGVFGSFVIASGPTGIEGTIWSTSGTWTISMRHDNAPDQQPSFERFEPDPTIGCAGGIVPQTPSSDHQVDPEPTETITSRGIVEPTRVLVVYNTDARDDVSDINAYIVAMIATANQAYINSETTDVQIELAGAFLLDETFSDDFRTVLRQSTNRYDAVGDTMHALRDATDADAIAMLVDQPGFCGLAWRSPGNASLLEPMQS